MPVIRNRLSSVLSGGPRQFNEIRNRFIITASNIDSISDVQSELESLDLRADVLNNHPVLIARPFANVSDTLETFRDIQDDMSIRKSIEEIENADGEIIDSTISTIRATSALLSHIQDLEVVSAADFIVTYADFGPEQLRISPNEMDTIPLEETEGKQKNQQELMEQLNMPTAWEMTTGENVTVAIFDTGFSKNLVSPSRITNTFSGEEVNSVWAPAEGHGTMTLGAAAANSDFGDVPYDGVAKGSDVILVRITDDEGQIRSDIIAKAWDWLSGLSTSNTIVSNHSYGMPICNSRPRSRACQSPDADLIRRITSRGNVTSVFAAGNEAGTCGRRLTGITNGITGVNSINEVFTVGALRFDVPDAQRYSSHGRGDCAPLSDPKPNVSVSIPTHLYYGGENGWEVKNMEMGIGGSSGGTSTASPIVAGKVALLQSRAIDKLDRPLQTEEIEQILHNNAEPPRPTQVNVLPGVAPKGWDARFGYGEVDIVSALRDI